MKENVSIAKETMPLMLKHAWKGKIKKENKKN